MKKSILFGYMVALLLISGCTSQQEIFSASEIPDNTSASAPAESAAEPVSQQLKDRCGDYIYTMLHDSTIINTWDGAPVPSDESLAPSDFVLNDVRKGDGVITVTAELYGNIYIDPMSLEETIGYGAVWITPENEPNAPLLSFGKSVVQFKESGDVLLPVSCVHERYPHPGLDYLKAQTEKRQPELSASEKIDVSKYDKLLVDYIWQILFAHRYIEKPEHITLYDLENLRDGIELHHGTIGADTEDPDYRLDASLLRLTPNLESVNSLYYLKDYSVFENMNGLRQLRIAWPGDELFSTLRVGHTDKLMIDDPDTDMLDMTNVNADALSLFSWSTAVRGFKGCDKIQKLYICATRTDMRLVNAETFPAARYLNLYFYSDTPRVRDFSQLATFDGIKIDLYLDYQACNNQTVESLQGVKLNDVFLTPENGTYPSRDLDRALTESLDANNISYGMELYFQERTGNEEISAEKRPLFSNGPGSIKVPLRIGEELSSWTLDHVESYDALSERITARFSGTARLKGRVRIYTDQDAPMPAGMVEFMVAEESLPLLPYYEHDTRAVWFEITNGDMIREVVGGKTGEFADCEITISGYEYVFAPMMCWNSSTVTEIHKIE